MLPSIIQLRLFAMAIYLMCPRCGVCVNINNQFYGDSRGCGSFDEIAHISSLDDRIRHNPSRLDENGGVAALHNSVTNFGSRTHVCGASLISERWLLSAAHCFNKEKLTGISIGRENLDEDTSPGINTYEIEEKIIHPDYKSSNYKYNDIALIRTNRVVQFGKKVWPYCLPSSHREIRDYMSVQISGWGYVNKTHSSPKLQIADIKIVENGRCDADWYNLATSSTYDNLKTFSYPNGLTQQVLCAGRKGVDACGGDSGGPLTYQNESGLYSVIGIVSGGVAHCPEVPLLPGFYTSVLYYLDWIYSTTGLHRPTTNLNSEQHITQPPSQPFARFTTPVTTKRPQPSTTTRAPWRVTTTTTPNPTYDFNPLTNAGMPDVKTVRDSKCVFPFIFGAVEYNECAPGIEQPHPWCATILNDNKTPKIWDVCISDTTTDLPQTLTTTRTPRWQRQRPTTTSTQHPTYDSNLPAAIGEPPSVCPPGQYIMVADPDLTYCDTYYKCSNGVAEKAVCSKGNHFDEKSGNCNWSKDVDRRDCGKIKHATCDSDHFRCPNSDCIRKKWLCDAEDDCGDWADEETCYGRVNGCPYCDLSCKDPILSRYIHGTTSVTECLDTCCKKSKINDFPRRSDVFGGSSRGGFGNGVQGRFRGGSEPIQSPFGGAAGGLSSGYDSAISAGFNQGHSGGFGAGPGGFAVGPTSEFGRGPGSNGFGGNGYGCPVGFFGFIGSNQCFQLFKEERLTWSRAKAECIRKGLQLASPSNAVAISLRMKLLEIFGYSGGVWVDARVETVYGLELIWQRSNTEFVKNGPLWIPGWTTQPGMWVKAGNCLRLNLFGNGEWPPEYPYGLDSCSKPNYMLCEAI